MSWEIWVVLLIFFLIVCEEWFFIIERIELCIIIWIGSVWLILVCKM